MSNNTKLTIRQSEQREETVYTLRVVHDGKVYATATNVSSRTDRPIRDVVSCCFRDIYRKIAEYEASKPILTAYE